MSSNRLTIHLIVEPIFLNFYFLLLIILDGFTVFNGNCLLFKLKDFEHPEINLNLAVIS